MLRNLHRAVPFCLVACIAGCSSSEVAPNGPPKNGAHFAETINAQVFYRGSIHAHTDKDGADASTERILAGYKKRNYAFAALTDYDRITSDHRFDDSQFITLPAVEMKGKASLPNGAPVGINVMSICPKHGLTGVSAEQPAYSLNQMIEKSKEADGITVIAHPNLGWAISTDTLLAAEGFELLEIASGDPKARDLGDDSHASTEELWDTYMTKKHRIYASAGDDSKTYLKMGDDLPNPGRTWLGAWANELSVRSICDALERGHFYASRGARISALVVNPQSIDVDVDNWNSSVDHIDFIGAGGKLLMRAVNNPAHYVLQGGEGYVRAHVVQGAPPEPLQGTHENENEHPRHGHGKPGQDNQIERPQAPIEHAPSMGTPVREAWTQAYFIKLK